MRFSNDSFLLDGLKDKKERGMLFQYHGCGYLQISHNSYSLAKFVL